MPIEDAKAALGIVSRGGKLTSLDAERLAQTAVAQWKLLEERAVEANEYKAHIVELEDLLTKRDAAIDELRSGILDPGCDWEQA